MKSLNKLKPEPGIWLVDVPIPGIGPNDVLIKIKKTAICGTDIHIYNWDKWAQSTIQTPMTIGHEFVGEIVELGRDVSNFKIGDRVSGEGHITCGHCRQCRAGKHHLCPKTSGTGVNRTGCFAEYLAFPAFNVFSVPDMVSDDMASIFDPLGNAVHTALSCDLVGEDVLITGAGPVGMMAAAICRFAGAKQVVITDVNPYRLELARKMGATLTIDASYQSLAEVLKTLNMPEGFDVGLEMSGNEKALNDLLQAMTCGGKVVLLGVPSDKVIVDWNLIVFKGLFLKGIYGREMFETWYKMVSMLQSGLDISAVITHHFPANEYEQAFKVMSSGNSGKVILDWE